MKKKQNKKLTEEELLIRTKKLKTLKIIVAIFDLLALIFLIWQIKSNTFVKEPYIMLLFCNIVTIFAKSDM